MTAESRRKLISLVANVALLGLLGAALWRYGPYFLEHGVDLYRPHTPDFGVLAVAAPALQVHIAAALSAFAIGAFLLVRKKGSGLHKTLGWVWVACMAVTAISSFFITGLNGNSYSLIHVLSGWTVIALPMAIFAIKRGNVRSHRGLMSGLFVGGLLVAGALTFLPGRLMHQIFFS